MAIAAACGFPEPELVPDGTTEAGADGATPEDDGGAGDGGFRADVVIEPDAPPPIDATSEKPPVDANCDPCDCDDDGFATDDTATCPDAGGKPRGDCDDKDSRANPDAGYRSDLPTLDTRGDWNCDTKVNRQSSVNIDCANYGGLGGGCSNVSGFTGDPGCGIEMSFVFCKTSGLTGCVQDPAKGEQRTQRCK